MKIFVLFVVLVLSGATLPAQTYSIIHSFANSDGRQPYNLVVSGDTLYGTTPSGGDNDQGSMFKINTDGTGFSLLYSPFYVNYDSHMGLLLSGNMLFGSDGSDLFVACLNETNYAILPVAGGDLADCNPLVLSGFTLYGTTSFSIFSLNTDGTSFTTMKSFTGSPDGLDSEAGLVLGGNTLYGTTYSGGTNYNHGTVFKINTDGMGYAVLHSFSNALDGMNPQADLVLNGSQLYGTTCKGGIAGYGTVFVINTNGTGYRVLNNFSNSPDGANPEAGLLLVGGTLYGTTVDGGSSGDGTVFQMNTNGMGYAVVHNFLGSPVDGAGPAGKLVVGSDGLYGTTAGGGTNSGTGTIFRLTLPPPQLQVTTAGNSPTVFWSNDGFSHNLQTTTNLASGPWTTVSNGVPLVGLQITNGASQPQAFFRLQ